MRKMHHERHDFNHSLHCVLFCRKILFKRFSFDINILILINVLSTNCLYLINKKQISSRIIRCWHKYALFTAAPSLIFNENESEAVRDRLASLQWAVLLFNVFLDCSAHETLEKYLSKKCQLTKNVPTM